MTDQPATDPTRIDVPVTSLVEAVRFIDAFAEIFFTLPRVVSDDYKEALRVELRDHIDRAGIQITDYSTVTQALPD